MAVVAEVDIIVHDVHFGSTLGIYREVVHVAGMVAFGILQAMLLSIRIEMRAGRLEVRRIALRLGMEVEGVHPGRQVMERRLYDHSRRRALPRLTSRVPPFLHSCFVHPLVRPQSWPRL
jgi:hypothetical protein